MLIRNYRKKKLLTLEELAQKSGVSRVNINRYELGTVEPKVINAYKIARALDCTVEDLISDEDLTGGVDDGTDRDSGDRPA